MEQSNHLFKLNSSLFKLPKSAKVKSFGIYLSGALYALGFWSIIDASIYSKTINASIIHVTFIDWIPFICSTLGMLIVSSIEKSNLFKDSSNTYLSNSVNSNVWAARIVLFFGFSLLAGGLAGSFMVFIVKFLLKRYGFPTLRMGISNIVCNICIMLSCIALWLSQSIEDEYSYSVVL